MPEDDPPTRAQLSTKLAELAHTLDWADMRSGNEPTCIELSQAIIDAAKDYQSAVRHFLRERGLDG